MSNAKPGRRNTLRTWVLRAANLAVAAVSALDAMVGSSGVMAWEHFPHGADIGVRGIGTTRSQAFEQAARALTAVIADPAQVAGDTLVEIRCEAPDHELLFADWLNALILEMATRDMLFGRFAVRSAITCSKQRRGASVSTACGTSPRSRSKGRLTLHCP